MTWGGASHALTAKHSATGRYDPNGETWIGARQGGGIDVAHALRAEGFDASEDGTGRGTPLVPVHVVNGNSTPETMEDCAFPLRADDGSGNRQVLAFDTTQITSKGNYSVPKIGDPCHPLAAGAHAPAVAFDCKASGRNGFGVGEIAPTLRAMGHKDGHANAGGQIAAFSRWGVRRLMPVECERLQAFPDNYTLIPWRGGMAPDGPRYKALGNSMAVNVMRWIGRRIEMVDALPAAAIAAE